MLRGHFLLDTCAWGRKRQTRALRRLPANLRAAVSWLAACRALDRRVWVLAVARLVVTAGYSMVMPFLAMHLAVERQVPWVTVGLIWFVAGGCGAVPSGWRGSWPTAWGAGR